MISSCLVTLLGVSVCFFCAQTARTVQHVQGRTAGTSLHCQSCRGAGQQAAMTCYDVPWHFFGGLSFYPTHDTGPRSASWVICLWYLLAVDSVCPCRSTVMYGKQVLIVERTNGVGKHVLCGHSTLFKLGQRVSGSRFANVSCFKSSMNLFSSYQFGEWCMVHGQHATRKTWRATWNFPSFCAGVMIVTCLYNPVHVYVKLPYITARSRLNVACRTFRMFTN